MSEFAATFDKDPAGYAAGRPGYSPEIFTALEERCGLGRGTTDDIVALFSTFSNMRLRPDAEREQVLGRIGAVVDDQFGGRARRTYQAVLYTGRKPGRLSVSRPGSR